MLLSYAKKLVLVTGGAGFIGSHITEHLIKLGAHVRVFDNLSTGYEKNIAHIVDHLEFIKGDIKNYDALNNAMKDVQIVFHLAAQVSVPGSVENPHHCFKTNLEGTVNVLEAARTNNVKRVIFSSSSAIYGNQEGPFCEDSTTPKPDSPYGLSKLMGEQLMKHYYQVFGIETTSLRYFNVYGDRQDPNAAYAAVIPKFKERMNLNKPIIIYGNGLQTRDFVSVQDVVKANLFFGITDKETNFGQSFNVAQGKSISLLQLADQLKEEYPQFSAGYELHPARPGDVLHTSADCSKFKKAFETLL